LRECRGVFLRIYIDDYHICFPLCFVVKRGVAVSIYRSASSITMTILYLLCVEVGATNLCKFRENRPFAELFSL
jgi:hypothetical protein